MRLPDGDSPCCTLAEEFHYDYFEIREGRLYYENMNRLLMTKDGIIRSAG